MSLQLKVHTHIFVKDSYHITRELEEVLTIREEGEEETEDVLVVEQETEETEEALVEEEGREVEEEVIEEEEVLEETEEEEVVEKESVIEPLLRQELSNYLVPALVDEVIYNLSDIIDIYEEKADIKPVEIR